MARTSPVFFKSGETEGRAVLADLSSSGALLDDVSASPNPGDSVTLTFELSQEGFRFQVNGHVARLTSTGFGVEFQIDPDPSVEALMQWILARPGRLRPLGLEEEERLLFPAARRPGRRPGGAPTGGAEAGPEPRAAEGSKQVPAPDAIAVDTSGPFGVSRVEPTDDPADDDTPALSSRATTWRRAVKPPRDPPPLSHPTESKAEPGARPGRSQDEERIFIRTGPDIGQSMTGAFRRGVAGASRAIRSSRRRGPASSLDLETIHRLLEGPPTESRAALVQGGIAILILLNAAAVAVGTVDGVAARYGAILDGFRVFSLTWFVVEYLVRLVVSTAGARGAGAFAGRARWALGPAALADLAALAPLFVPPLRGLDLRALRVLRLLPALGSWMPTRYARAATRTASVLADRSADLAVLVLGMGILLVPLATTLYLVEHPVQPEAFPGILDAAWWVLVTFATIGQTDMIPVTSLGKLIGGLVAMLGIGLAAVAAGILASGFVRSSDEPTCPRCGGEGGRESKG